MEAAAVSLLFDALSNLNNKFSQTTSKQYFIIAMAYPVHRKHRHYHSKPAMKATVQRQDSRNMWSVYDMDSLSLSPTSTSLTPPTHLTAPTHPSEFLQLNNAVLDHTLAPTMQPSAPHNIFALPPTSPAQLPPHTILAILLLIVTLTLAATWTLLVCLIHHRGTTTGLKPHTSTSSHAARTRPDSPSPAPSTHGGAWSLNPFQRACGPKHKYEALEHRDADAEDKADGARALSSALELRSLKSPGGEDGSPLNLFLAVPGRESKDLGRGGTRRGEEEWVVRHRAFFGGEGGENSRASLLGMGDDRGTDEVQDGEALLAGAAGLLVFERGDSAWRRNWVDWGLAAVDGAVDRLTAKIVRWTDEGDLVLPIAES